MSGGQSADRPSRWHRPRLWLGTVAVFALVVSAIWHMHRPASAAAAHAELGAVSVHTALATRRDVPVYVEGLGTVQAFYTATLTAQVNGQLQRVFFTEGQLVKKGELLAQIDPRPLQAALDQAVATEEKDAAQLESAKLDLARYTVLAPQNLTSKQTLDQQRALVAQLTAQLQIDRAAIDNARTQLEYTRITAPFNGRTGIRLIDPGNIVHATDTGGVVVITQVQPISVVFTLPEDALGGINRAMAGGPVKVNALSQDGKTQLDTGTLTVVDNQINPTTGTMRLKATFPNPRNTLWPGEFVNAQVLVSQEHDVVTVPTEAVQIGPGGPFTYVVKSDLTVEVRPVALGVQNGNVTVITSGVSAGERVVTSNQFRLEPGTRVQTAS